MGLFKRPESKFYWLYLETTRRREPTKILLGDTASQRKDNKALALEVYHERMRETARGVHRLPVERPAIRFTAYATTYATDVIALRRGAQRELEMLQPLRLFFADRLLSLIDADLVRTYMAQRKAQPRTVNREVDLLKGMLRDAVPKYLKVSPIVGLKRIKVSPLKRRLLAPAEEKRLLAVCEDPQDTAILVLGIDTMMRLRRPARPRADRPRRPLAVREGSEERPRLPRGPHAARTGRPGRDRQRGQPVLLPEVPTRREAQGLDGLGPAAAGAPLQKGGATLRQGKGRPHVPLGDAPDRRHAVPHRPGQAAAGRAGAGRLEGSRDAVTDLCGGEEPGPATNGRRAATAQKAGVMSIHELLGHLHAALLNDFHALSEHEQEAVIYRLSWDLDWLYIVMANRKERASHSQPVHSIERNPNKPRPI